MNIGILEVEDSVDKFSLFIREGGFFPKKVEKKFQLNDVKGLIIAGRDALSFDDKGLRDEIVKKTLLGMPILGMCAGVISLAKNIEGKRDVSLGLMDITVRTNRIKKSTRFMADLTIPVLGEKPVKAIFNKSPYIVDAKPNVGILCTYVNKIVMARQGNFLVSSFYSNDSRVYSYFFRMVKDSVEL